MGVEHRRVNEQRLIQVLQGILDLIVAAEFDAFRPKFIESPFGCRVFDRLLEHIPVRRIFPYEQIRDHIRVVVDVGCPDIQQPGYFVKCRDEAPAAVVLLHPAPQTAEALSSALSRIHREDRSLGNGRTVLPEA